MPVGGAVIWQYKLEDGGSDIAFRVLKKGSAGTHEIEWDGMWKDRREKEGYIGIPRYKSSHILQGKWIDPRQSQKLVSNHDRN